MLRGALQDVLGFTHMARFGEHAVWFAFTSDRFDHSSDLPPEANAGNRFYGRDVASFITAGLSERGLDASFFDEDWGWQAHAKRLGRGDTRDLRLPQPGGESGHRG